MTWFDFVVIALAAGQLVDSWRNAGILAGWRAYCEAWLDVIDEEAPLESWRAFLSELLSCNYCLAHHTPWVVLGLLWAPGYLWPHSLPALVLRFVLYVLAAVRLGWLLNSWAGPSARYERKQVHDGASLDTRGERANPTTV